MNTDNSIKGQITGLINSIGKSVIPQKKGPEISSHEINQPHVEHPATTQQQPSVGGKHDPQTAQSWSKIKLGSLVRTIRSLFTQETSVQKSASPPALTQVTIPKAASFDPETVLAKPSVPERMSSQRMEVAEKLRAMTGKLDSAMEISKKTGNNALLKLTLQEAEGAVAHLMSRENKLDLAMIPSMLKLQTKMEECKQKKSELPSEKKQVFNALFQDLVKNNQAIEASMGDIKAQFKDQAKSMGENEHHQIHIGGKTYVISRDAEVNKGTAIPSIWKREDESFASGAVAEIYGGKWIVNPKNEEDLAVKVVVGEVTSLSDMVRELRITQAVHKNGEIPGVVPTPALVFYDNQVSVLMKRQDSDGIGLASTKPGERFTENELKEVVSKSLGGLKEIHQAGYYHGDVKGSNLLWNEKNKNLMVADLEGSRDFKELFAANKFPTMDDVQGNYTHFSPEIYEKIEGLLLQSKADYQLAASASQVDVQKSIVKSLMKEMEPLLVANDQYAHGLALCESLIPSFSIPCGHISTSDLAKQSIEIQMERANVPPEVREMIYPLFNGVSEALPAERSPTLQMNNSFKSSEELQSNLQKIAEHIKAKSAEERPPNASQIIKFIDAHITHMIATKDPAFTASKSELIESLNTIKNLMSENPNVNKGELKLFDQAIARITGDENTPIRTILQIKLSMKIVNKSERANSQKCESVSKDIEILIKKASITQTEKEDLQHQLSNYRDNFINNLNLSGLPETGLTTASLNKALEQLEQYHPAN